MANATCQFTQGVTIGGNGQSVTGFSANTLVTMTDAGGNAASTTWQWQIISWPSPLSSPPSITNSTSRIATLNPTLDGVYIVKLTRVENGVTTIDTRFFGVVDDEGLCLPSAGQTGTMSNVGATPTLAQNAGWMGRADASTNSMLDAYLRLLRAKVKASYSPRPIPIVAGIQSTISQTFTRMGVIRFDPSIYTRTVTIKFQVIAEATPGQTVEFRLYNTTDGGAVSGSTLSTSSQTPVVLEATLSGLTASAKIYEAQFRLSSTPSASSDRGTCTHAELNITW